MKTDETNKLALKIYNSVKKELESRKGFRDLWEPNYVDGMDRETIKELRETNVKNISAILNKHLTQHEEN